MCEPGAIVLCRACEAHKRQKRARETDAAVGARIRERRLALGWTIAQVAPRIGIRFGRLVAIELGEARPSAVEFYDIARALGVTIGFFFR